MNCYVLVGGRSLRMGVSKSGLFFADVRRAAEPVFDEVIAVQRHAGEPVAGVRTIFEEDHVDRGPVFGLLRALRDADRRCFILAVDYPYVTASLLRALRDAVEISAALLVVPVWDGEPQVLCAGYATSLAAMIERRIAAGKLDLRGLIEESGAEMIGEASLRARFSGEPLRNVNSPEEMLRERVDG